MARTIQELLLFFVLVVLVLWYISFLWKKKKLYWYSWNVPGPVSLPIIGGAYSIIGHPDDILDNINNCIAKYPSLCKLWIGHQLVYSFTDPDHIEKLVTNKKCLAKGDLYRFMAYVIGDGLGTAPVPIWKKHKKAIMPSFNQKILDSYVDIFAEQSVILTEVLEEHVGDNKTDISQPITAFTLDTICESAMGLKMNTQKGCHTFATDMEILMEITTLRISRIWHHLEWTWKLYPLSKKFDKHVVGFHRVTSTLVKEKMKAFQQEQKKKSLVMPMIEGTKKQKAFLDLMLENSEFTEQELIDEVEIFLVAGTDTTAMTTCFFLEMLGLFPDIQQKVYEEVIDVIGEERLVESSDLPKLQYMERVLKETMRIFPVVGHFFRTVGEDVQLGKYTIPEGATALFSSININMNPKYWPEPFKFDPDRFLPEEVAKRHPCSYISFSFGPRNCIGAKYAMMNLKTVAATLIRKYRVFTGYKSVEEIELKTKMTLRPKHGFKFYLEHR